MSVLAAVMTLIAVKAHAVVACELKRAPRSNAGDFAVRKPARPNELDRTRVERRESLLYAPAPSRRIILQ